MELFPAAKQQIEAEAVEWFVRLPRADCSRNEHEALSEWLTRSPVHVEEYLAVSSTWVGLALPDEGEFSTDRLIAEARNSEHTNVCRLETASAINQKSQCDDRGHRDRRLQWAALAAAIVLGLGTWAGSARWHLPPIYKTAVGEQRSVSLADGSVIVLNTHSEVRVRFTARERHVELIMGEGQFHVAKNPTRPFRVQTADATVKAVGTVFNVRDDPAGTQVAVLEGAVELSASGAAAVPALPRTAAGSSVSVDLAAGQRAAVTLHGIQRDAGPILEAVAAWTERRLVFRDQTLADVVAEFNRYLEHPLVVDDSQLAALKIGGVFDASDPQSLVSYLQSFETVLVRKAADGSLHLARGQ